MLGSDNFAFHRQKHSSSRMRAPASIIVITVAVAFSMTLGPVTAANAADTHTVETMTELADAFANASTGDTIALANNIGDGAVSTRVAVPANTSLTLDLSGHTLILQGASSFPGLGVPADTELTIADTSASADGELIAAGGSGAAGIGGEWHALEFGRDGGTITITGGTITATGGFGGAGIGGADGAAGGVITIDGGTTTATGGFSGAGIGGGWRGADGTTVINSGTTTATGGENGAGIGGGSEGSSGTTAINGGTTTAIGGKFGSGIGGGSVGNGGETTITGGALTATGGLNAAGIGGGNNGNGGITTLHGGTTMATGGINAAGIGGGSGIGSNAGDGGTTTIHGGTTTAAGGPRGAGIGGGYYGNGGVTTIYDGTATATSDYGGAGIGGGMDGDGGILTIHGGTTTATGGELAAGIGGGNSGHGAGVSIGVNAEVFASSYSGIAVGAGQHGTGFGMLQNDGTLTVPATAPVSATFPSPVPNMLRIPATMTVTNMGTIINEGQLIVDGTLQNDGAIVNTTGAITNPANITVHNTSVALDGTGGTAPANPPTLYSGSFHDGQVPFPADATRSGYTFAGWHTAASGDTQVTDITNMGTGGPKTTTLYAQWTPLVPTLSLTVTLATGSDPNAAGNTVLASGTNLLPSSPFTVTMNSTPVVLFNGTVPASGTASQSMTLPGTIAAGHHSIRLVATSAAGAHVDTAAWFAINNDGTVAGVSYTGRADLPTITAPAATLGLAATGNDSGEALLGTSLLLLALGAALVIGCRRPHGVN